MKAIFMGICNCHDSQEKEKPVVPDHRSKVDNITASEPKEKRIILNPGKSLVYEAPLDTADIQSSSIRSAPVHYPEWCPNYVPLNYNQHIELKRVIEEAESHLQNWRNSQSLPSL